MNRLYIGRRHSKATLLVVLCWTAICGASLSAQYELLETLNGFRSDSSFGATLAIEGDRFLVGAPWEMQSNGTRGQVDVFRTSSGTSVRRFRDPTPATRGFFGVSVAVGGDVALISERFGEVHQFNIATGELMRTYSDPTPSGSDEFGWSIAMQDDLALIGAPFHDPVAGRNVGEAHVFDVVSGELVRTISNPINNFGDAFGYQVAIDDGRALVGAPFDFTPANQGKAHLFDLTTGALLSTFLDPSNDGSSSFGFSLELDGNYVAAGSPYDNSGEIHFFDSTTGDLLHTVLPPTRDASYFGSSFQIDGDQLLVGAGGAVKGKAFLIDLDTLTLRQIFSDYTPSNNRDGFGRAVALTSDHLVIGAPYIEKAYLFVAVPEPIILNTILPLVVWLGRRLNIRKRR